ncbi:MAG: General secretion pathway protein K [Syntrophorhabdaceae bacterium PtaU1.Bin034]|nr:MAG: General secretion pathway protein K [Syntrophorhabdaceae bacterium PtaU1.Bin034]
MFRTIFCLNDRGVALLMVLWVLMILMTVVVSFAFLVRAESRATLFFKQKAEKRFLAEAGIQRAIMELMYRGVAPDSDIRVAGTEPVRVDGTLNTGQLGEDFYTYRIIDESGKIGLNQLNDASGLILINLLVNLGVSKEQADTIVDSILDWKDSDELHRLDGAETDYYLSLPVPYRSKNARFDALDELVMVRGIAPEILYGSRGKSGIIDFLTVDPAVRAINLNSAPGEVLAALPGVSREMADRIVVFRNSARIASPEDIESIVGESFRLMKPYVGTSESNAYSIESTGYKKGEKHGLAVKAVVTLEGNGKYKYAYYKNPAGVRQGNRPGREIP